MALHLEVAGRSDIGCVRANNEDNFGYDTRYGVYVVCDGMGGQAAGEVASKMGVDCVLGYFREQAKKETSEMPVASADGPTPLAKSIGSAISVANRAIHDAVAKNPSRSGMGSTVAVVLVDGDSFAVGHVGDTRIYLIRDRHIEQLTNDHSLVAEHVRRGLMTKEQADRSEVQNILLQALGSDDVEPDLGDFTAADQDILLLATDGLTRHVPEEKILELLLSSPLDPNSGCNALIEAARSGGGYDNITCLVLKFSAAELPADSSNHNPKWQDSL